MKFLKPHLYLDPIPGKQEFELTVIVLVSDNLVLKRKPDISTKPIPSQPGKKARVIDLTFDDQLGVIHPKPMEFNFRFKDPGTTADEVQVTVNCYHGPHPRQDHDGSSTAHYSDPRP